MTLDPRINYKLLRLFRYAGNKYLLTMSRGTKSNALFSSVCTSYCFFKTMNLLLACKYVYNIRVSMPLTSFWTVLSTLHVYCSPGFLKEVACFFWTDCYCMFVLNLNMHCKRWGKHHGNTFCVKVESLIFIWKMYLTKH